MRSLIVHNPASGYGSNAVFEFVRELVRPEDECVIRSLGSSPVADALSDADDFDLVVISAGDGTLTNALYALRNSDVTTCVFPSGTANLLFANLGNAPEPKSIATACHEGTTRALDLGEMSWVTEDGTEHVSGFGIMSGIGFDAELMSTAEQGKATLGEAAYFTAAFSNLNPKVADFTVTVDGEEHRCRGISCIVANAAMMQGDIILSPGCRMDDGLLDVMVLEAPDAVRLLLPIIAGFIDPSGDILGRPHIVRFRGRQIEISSSEPLHIQLDGDAMEGLVTGYTARCLPACNPVIVDPHSPYYAQA